jgi:DNA replication protein DnaC
MEVKPFECLLCGKKIRPIINALPMLRGIKNRYCFKCVDLELDKEREAKEQLEISYIRKKIGLPYNFVKEFESEKEIEHSLNVDDLFSNMEESQKGVYLWGPIGTGKSFLASFILWQYAVKKIQGYYVSASSIDPLGTFSRDYRLEMSNPCSEKLFSEYSLVVIDDLGNHKVNNLTISAITEAINFRLERSCMTIITSNSNPIELAKRLKQIGSNKVDPIMCDSIADRILELCHPIKMDGDSRRVKKFLASQK